MRTKSILTCAALVLATVVGASLSRRATAADEDVLGVRKTCGEFVTAWAQHDPKALAALFVDDGDAINPMGRYASGRAEIEKLFADEHGAAGPMRESTITVHKEPVRFPSADVAVSDAEVTVNDVYRPDGTKGPVEVHVTNVWKKVGGAWRIYASRPYIKTQAPEAH